MEEQQASKAKEQSIDLDEIKEHTFDGVCIFEVPQYPEGAKSEPREAEKFICRSQSMRLI